MTSLTLEALGLTPQEITDRIVDRYVEQLRVTYTADENGDRVDRASDFDRAMQKRITERIDAEVTRLAEMHVLPRVASMVENVVLQKTNSWGEKVGQPVSFVEYLVQRAEAFMTEKVDFKGRSKGEDGNSYSWNGTQTRVAYMLHSHLHYSIETAMKAAVANANSAISAGIAETVKIKLGEIAQNLKVKVETK